ncbi:unnamed protein product [Fusarium graminearum]|nr:unnamed protein product [Fusarium graminearum]
MGPTDFELQSVRTVTNNDLDEHNSRKTAIQPLVRTTLVQYESIKVITCVGHPKLEFIFHSNYPDGCSFYCTAKNRDRHVIAWDAVPAMLDICPQNLVVRKTKDKLRNMDTAGGESQVYLWSDNQSPGVPDGAYKHTLDEYYYEKNTLKQRYFVSSVANGTSTGVYRHHAVRMDSTAKCSVEENLLKSCSGKNPFRTSFVSERLKIEICVEGSYDAVPWTKSRDKQEHSERMWLSWTYDDSEDVEDEESVGQPIWKPNSRDNYVLKCSSAQVNREEDGLSCPAMSTDSMLDLFWISGLRNIRLWTITTISGTNGPPTRRGMQPVVRVLLGLQVAGLCSLMLFIYRAPAWTNTLDADAMVQIGGQLKEWGEPRPALKEVSGVIGVERTGQNAEASTVRLSTAQDDSSLSRSVQLGVGGEGLMVGTRLASADLVMANMEPSNNLTTPDRSHTHYLRRAASFNHSFAMASLVDKCGYYIRHPRRIPKRLIALSAVLSLVVLLTLNMSWSGHSQMSIINLPPRESFDTVKATNFLLDNPIESPYKTEFWEVGQRSKQIGRWLGALDALPRKSKQSKDISVATEKVAQALFPFLKNSDLDPDSVTPLADLRDSYVRGSRGIIIHVGGGQESVRFASHLIVSLRRVLYSKLPIQIAYAGDKDLSPRDRVRIQSMKGATDMEFLDVLSVFNDTTLRLQGAGWAIKPFALLASKFEQAILIDANVVFMQKPEKLFEQRPYVNKGAYLFHDRLLWKDMVPKRHIWWKDQIKEPSDELKKSQVWQERYSEECDTGVIVVDKSKIPIFTGLLHIAWQNTRAVREEVAYKLGHGDKESWWLGFELTGARYEFEAHYGSVIGWGDSPDISKVNMVCSFGVAHLDTHGQPLWYNGGVLENMGESLAMYRIPSYWMMGGVWEKGATRKDMSCMSRATAYGLTDTELNTLAESIDAAKEVDRTFAKD